MNCYRNLTYQGGLWFCFYELVSFASLITEYLKVPWGEFLWSRLVNSPHCNLWGLTISRKNYWTIPSLTHHLKIFDCTLSWSTARHFGENWCEKLKTHWCALTNSIAWKVVLQFLSSYCWLRDCMLDDKELLANNCNSAPNLIGCLAIYSVNSRAVVGVQRVRAILNVAICYNSFHLE